MNKLMLSMGLPMIISMVLQAFYNIVDSAFVSNMKSGGEEALNALTLAFPIQMLLVAVSISTSVGMNALIAKSLGRGDSEQASKVAGNAEFLTAVIYYICLLFGIAGTKAYISSQTANSSIGDMGISYLRICCCASVGIVYFSVFKKLLQATGLSLYSTIAQIAGAVTNIILDPILIYGWIGLPEMGVKGAALATVIGQIVSFLLALMFHVKLNRSVKNGFQCIRPSSTVIKAIYFIGLHAIIAQALMSVMTYGLNLILVKISENMVTAYGLFYKIQQFILIAAFGLRDAITPIDSFNHGLKNKSRINAGIKYGMFYTLIIMAVGFAALEILAVPFAGVFGLSGETEKLCISAMRIISVSFIFAGANVAYQGVFQALDSGVESLVISLLRQLIIVLPVACLFSFAAREDSSRSWIVWFSFVISEGVTTIAAFLLMRRVRRNKIEALD